MKKNGIFLVTVLLAMLFWQWTYFEIKGHYSGLMDAQFRIESLQEQVTRAQVKTKLIQYQFDLFKQQITKRIPEVLPQLDSLRQKEGRGLASVLQTPNEEYLILARFETLIEDMKVLFENKKYQSVIQKGKLILDQNPISPSLVTVYFMLAESYFQTNEFEACFDVSEQMIRLFPENPKTGYVLLRIGIFLKEKNRFEEAKNMFLLVGHAFEKEKNLKLQSNKLLADLETLPVDEQE